jgi:hypothetical protein
MIDAVLEQLKSLDPEERKKAIITLGRLRNKVAMKPLEEVFRKDPDPDLRALAYKVGRYIMEESQKTNPIRGTVTEPDFLPDTSPWDIALGQVKAPRRSRVKIDLRRQLMRRHMSLAALLMLIGAILFILFLFHRVLPL